MQLYSLSRNQTMLAMIYPITSPSKSIFICRTSFDDFVEKPAEEVYQKPCKTVNCQRAKEANRISFQIAHIFITSIGLLGIYVPNSSSSRSSRSPFIGLIVSPRCQPFLTFSLSSTRMAASVIRLTQSAFVVPYATR